MAHDDQHEGIAETLSYARTASRDDARTTLLVLIVAFVVTAASALVPLGILEDPFEPGWPSGQAFRGLPIGWFQFGPIGQGFIPIRIDRWHVSPVAFLFDMAFWAFVVIQVPLLLEGFRSRTAGEFKDSDASD